MSTPPARMLGRYRLETLLGSGGMAEVWRAEDTKLGRAVAVKVILADHVSDSNFVTRFLREARVVASLEHPNILPVYDFGEENGLPFLVMPFLEGGTLRDLMLGRPVPLPKAATWIGQLASALDAAHEAGVLHRDVKPANVLIGKADRAFLADFGIAKMLETATGLTATGMVMGTPLYMAPEQARGSPATPATDRYALAVIAYELLAGKPPFEGESPLSLMHQHVTSPAPALSSRVSGLPAGLDAVFTQALAKDPVERHPTSAAFAAAIGMYVPTGSAEALRPTAVAATRPTVVETPRSAPAIGAAPGRSRPLRPQPVATPPPGLTSDQTIFTGARSARRKLVWGVAAAVVAVSAMAGGFLLLRGKENPPVSGDDGTNSAASPLAAVPQDSSKVKEPGTAAPPPEDSSKVKEPRAASASSAVVTPASPLHDSLSKKSPVSSSSSLAAGAPAPGGSSKVREPGTTSASSAASARRPEAERPRIGLLEAIARLDTWKRPQGRLTREDFELAVTAAQAALKENPEFPEARYLEIYGSGGLAYLAGNDGDAAQALVEAFAFMKRAGRREIHALGFILRGPGGSIVPPKGWELALAYGDARGEAEPLLDAALETKPNSAKALLGRAHLRRLQGRKADFLADLKRAAATSPAPQVRQGVLEILRAACRNGLAEACTEVQQLPASPAPAQRRRFAGVK